MSRLYLILMIPLLLASGLYAIPRTVPLGYAASSGIVCLAVNGSTTCPVTPPLISTSSTVPQQLLIAVVIDNSSAMNSFDITIHTNSTILKPANATLGNVLSLNGATVLAKCIGGTGLGCGALDNRDTLHFSVSSSLTSTPTTGLLFTANYTISGTATKSPITFLSGCTKTSVSGLCVTIGSGTANPNIETAQSATFTNQPYFDLQPALKVASLTVAQGGTDSSSLFLNATSVNGFSGTVTVTNTVLPIQSSDPVVSVSPTSLKVNVSSTNLVFFQVTVHVDFTVPPDVYTLNFTGTSPGYPQNNLVILLTVPAQGFTITPGLPANTPLFLNVTSSNSTTITLTSAGNFSGTVSLALVAPPQLQASLQATSLRLPYSLNGAQSTSNSTTVTIRCKVAGTYVLTVNATSGTISQTASIGITVRDMAISVQFVGALTIPLGATAAQSVLFGPATSTGIFDFQAHVTNVYVTAFTSLGPFTPSTGLSVTCVPSTVAINPPYLCNPSRINVTVVGTGEQPVAMVFNVTGNQLGDYTVTVEGASGAIVHAVSFPVEVVGPDFAITPSQFIQPVTVGNTTRINVLVSRSLGLNSGILLTADFKVPGNPPSPPSATVSPASVILNSTYPNATAIVTITVSSQAPTGTYFLEVKGHSPITGADHVILIAIVVTTTTSPHDLGIYSVEASGNSATIGSNVTITILVQNLGKVSETSTVVALAGDTSVGQENVTIGPGENTTVTLTWNTNGYTPGAYMIGAKVLGVNGETILSNNLLRSPSPVTLSAANTSVLSSPYFLPAIIIALVVILGLVGFLFLQTRRKTPSQQT